ncbi:MAG: 50S ribosomal protein L10 [Bacillota bacterium]|nr:50S ribosomal protein L10 [Bacillota bacterium]
MPSAQILEKKKQVVSEIIDKLKSASAGVFVNYCGLTVEEDTELRRKFREVGVEYKVIKNTLTRFAANEVGFEALDPILNGPTALAISDNDPIAPAKVIGEFAKKHEDLVIKAGFMDGALISIDEIKALAEIPSKEILISKIMGSLQSPISGLARLLNTIVTDGVEIADLIAKKAGEAAPAEEVAPVEEASEAAPAEEAVSTEEK